MTGPEKVNSNSQHEFGEGAGSRVKYWIAQGTRGKIAKRAGSKYLP